MRWHGSRMPLISTLLAVLTGRGRKRDRCLVCRRGLAADEPQMRLPGGGYVHSSCATYSMRSRPLRPATD
jgi:hypothetical protein